MKKRDELADSKSCINSAEDDEWVFVLKSTDRHAPATVEFWATLRALEGKTDKAKVDEAFGCATNMRIWKLANPGTKSMADPIVTLTDGVMNVAEALLRKADVCSVSFLTPDTVMTDEQQYAAHDQPCFTQLVVLHGEYDDPIEIQPGSSLRSAYELARHDEPPLTKEQWDQGVEHNPMEDAKLLAERAQVEAGKPLRPEPMPMSEVLLTLEAYARAKASEWGEESDHSGNAYLDMADKLAEIRLA